MDRNVYILGAGFSRPAKAPLMEDFLDRMREHATSREVASNDKEWFEVALEFRRSVSKLSDNFELRLDNIEHLFGLFEIYATAGQRSHDDRSKFVNAILRTLELSIKWAPESESIDDNWTRGGPDRACREHVTQHHNKYPITWFWLYHAFAQLVGHRYESKETEGDAIITFNYDLLLHRALYELGYKVDYGNEAPMAPGVNPKNARDIPPVPLFKLHGSANWMACGTCGRLFIAPAYPIVSDAAASLLRWSLNETYPHPREGGAGDCGGRGVHTPLIVPPTWNRAESARAMRKVWTGALSAIQKATRVFVIGYSLPETDTFFRFLIAAGLQVGEGVHLYVVDPEPKVAERYRQYLAPVFAERRFTPLTSTKDTPIDTWGKGMNGNVFTEFLKLANRTL